MSKFVFTAAMHACYYHDILGQFQFCCPKEHHVYQHLILSLLDVHLIQLVLSTVIQ